MCLTKPTLISFPILDPIYVPHSSRDPDSHIDFNYSRNPKSVNKALFLADLNAKSGKYSYLENNFVYMCPNKCRRSYKNYKGNLSDI